MICLTAATLSSIVMVNSFTLAWTHSIEKIRWEEDWRVESEQLVIAEARIRGSGAGMEPPAGATFKDGVWHYRPDLPAQLALRLTHSPYTTGYEFCVGGRCGALADHLPGIENTTVIELRPCAP
jgi:hypothetical protein